MPLNQKPTISDDKVTSVSTNEDEVSKETSVESSGDIIDDTETSIETEDRNNDDNGFDGQLDVPRRSIGKSLFCTFKLLNFDYTK